MKHAKKDKTNTYTGKEKQPNDYVSEETQMLDLVGKTLIQLLIICSKR